MTILKKMSGRLTGQSKKTPRWFMESNSPTIFYTRILVEREARLEKARAKKF